MNSNDTNQVRNQFQYFEYAESESAFIFQIRSMRRGAEVGPQKGVKLKVFDWNKSSINFNIFGRFHILLLEIPQKIFQSFQYFSILFSHRGKKDGNSVQMFDPYLSLAPV